VKIVYIIIDGLSDEPIPELDNKTPLEVAFAPNIHYIANKGQVGRINTVFEGFPIESMVCIMGLLGYHPQKYYPNGRASFEAMAKGIPLYENDIVFRCNIVEIDKKTKKLKDFTSNLISDRNARKIISKIKLPFDNWEIYPGQSYRNILIIRNSKIDANQVKCFPPHMNIGNNINEIMPVDINTDETISCFNDFLLDSHKQISNLDIDTTGNMLWLWSPSVKPVWQSFKDKTGLKAASVSGLDFLQGMSMAANIDYDIIPGATGYIDTNYKAKADYTINYVDNYDFVLTHINATDEEAHQLNFKGKQKAIEVIDKELIAPVLYHLETNYKNDFRIIISGDHMTSSIDGKHKHYPVPYAVYGKNIESSFIKQFSERELNTFKTINSLQFFKKYK